MTTNNAALPQEDDHLEAFVSRFISPISRLSPLRPGWPFTVQYRVSKRTGLITLTMKAPVAVAKNLLATLHVLTELGVDLRRQAERAERDVRVDWQMQAWRCRLEEIRQAYGEYRSSGLLHRAAVRALVADPRFADLKWGFSTFNHMLPPASEWKKQNHSPVLRLAEEI